MIPVAVDDGWQVEVDPQWPGFAGHFPSNPIVPAAELIDWALAIAGPVGALVRARFVVAVRPGDRLRLTRAASSRGTVVIVTRGAETVAELLLADAP